MIQRVMGGHYELFAICFTDLGMVLEVIPTTFGAMFLNFFNSIGFQLFVNLKSLDSFEECCIIKFIGGFANAKPVHVDAFSIICDK